MCKVQSQFAPAVEKKIRRWADLMTLAILSVFARRICKSDTGRVITKMVVGPHELRPIIAHELPPKTVFLLVKISLNQ
jgi:hypothetical protein